jgi:hypothetical protein
MYTYARTHTVIRFLLTVQTATSTQTTSSLGFTRLKMARRAIRLGAERPRSGFQAGAIEFSPHYDVHIALGPTRPWFFLWRGIKWQRREANHSPPSIVKEWWSYIFTPPYVFMPLRLIKFRSKFTFFYLDKTIVLHTSMNCFIFNIWLFGGGGYSTAFQYWDCITLKGKIIN